MYGSVSENTCAPTANSKLKTSCGERAATQTSSRQIIEAPQTGFDDRALKCFCKSKTLSSD